MFLVQAIREDGLVVGAPQSFTLDPVVDKGATGLQLVYAWASGTPQRLKFKVAATDGTFVGDWSAASTVVSVGEQRVMCKSVWNAHRPAGAAAAAVCVRSPMPLP